MKGFHCQRGWLFIFFLSFSPEFMLRTLSDLDFGSWHTQHKAAMLLTAAAQMDLSHILGYHWKHTHTARRCFSLVTACRESKFSGLVVLSGWGFESPKAKQYLSTLISKAVIGPGPSARHFTIFMDLIFSLCAPFYCSGQQGNEKQVKL